MPNSSSTVVVDSSTTTNAAVPLAYGPVWVTGKRAEYYELQNTGSDNLDFTRVGIWLLGEGEWDGCHELWINDTLIWTSEYADLTQFHFHRGSDAMLGNYLGGSSSGPDQGVDSFWSLFPTAVQPLAYSRIAYYAIKRKQPIENQANDHQNDPTQWADLTPIGLWRSTRVRLFDDEGTMTGYAYSTNPAWHFVDAILRRKIFPEYNIDLNTGIDDISAAARNRFEWGDIWSAAQYFDQLLANGRRRFQGAYTFSQTTTLAAILEQILKCCRSFQREYAGKISLICDQTRPSVFTFSRNNILPGSPSPSDKTVSAAPNCYVGKFRDLLVPTAATIASIGCPDHQNPTVTTEAPHPFNVADLIAIGGTNTIYDGRWSVYSIPDADTLGNVYSMTLISKGSNYPSVVGSGGSVGLLYSRFKERAPQFDHQNNQLARGAVGVGLPRQLNRVRVEYDYATSTFDQVSRITRFERDLALGPDQSPYVTPRAVTIKTLRFAKDTAGSGTVVAQIQPGDHVSLDDTANYAYSGEYQVMDATHRPYNAQAAQSGGSLALTAAADGGEVELTLGPYLASDNYDVTDPNSAGWSNVPGSDPGNNGPYTGIDLLDGGILAFLSGAVASGDTFNLPSSGFPPANLLAWASPQGYVEGDDPMAVIYLCDVDANRKCTLDYMDNPEDIWNGDVNYAGLTWLGSTAEISTVVIGVCTFILATLAGGEQICFGKGVLADGETIPFPPGFTPEKSFAAAFPHDGIPLYGWDAHGVGAYIDSGGVVHLNYQDGEGDIWHGNAAVLIFGWKNNSGLVTTQSVGGGNWMLYPSSKGFTLGVGLASLMNGAVLSLPSAAGTAQSLQIMAGPHDFKYGSWLLHHAHGVASCYVDASLTVNMTFEDGEGNVWPGLADVFGLFYEPTTGAAASAGGIAVSVSPWGMTVPAGGQVQFTASVTGSTAGVVWLVDGIPEGNATVGTMSGTAPGLYTAPATNGVHLITAMSAANNAAFGSQQVGVGGFPSGRGYGISVVLSPLQISLSLSETCQFTAAISGTTDTAITWLVNGIMGGNATVGTISTTGLFTAVATGNFQITAQLTDNPSVTFSATAFIGTGIRPTGGPVTGSGR
jgi:hypothetical protein